ncbi:MAG: cation:proton antiporter, partial [Acidimicrobiales bacterium]
LAFGESTNTAIFVGAALTATSVGITARVFGDLRALASVEARTVLGAAVADDVLGLIILTVVVRLVADGSVSVLGVASVAGLAVAFLVVTAGIGSRLAPALFGLVQRWSRSAGTLVAVALAFALAFAELASAARLATVVGAFVAGLSLARSDQAERIRRDLTPVGHLFVPVFFLQIGIDADVASLVRPHVLLVASGLLTVAVLGKLAAAVGMVGSPGDRILVGLGMLPRGEVGLIFAGLGLREGILGDDLYAAVLLVVLVTTLVTPPLLGRRMRALRAETRTPVAAGPTPPGGWLVVEHGVVDLRPAPGPPPAQESLSLGLEAALAASSSRPGPRLLDWLGAAGDVPAVWDAAARSGLFELLRHGNARSWRFLETTGLLQRALPELAEALRRRRADPSELDPAHGLRFSLVDRTHELAAELADGALAHPEYLALAALLVELDADLTTAGQVVRRLDLGAAGEREVALLVGESGLMRASAVRPDGLDEERVLQIASHLERPERATALYLLSVALGDLVAWQRQRLDALDDLVQQALTRPELAGRSAANLAEQRRADAVRLLGTGTAGADRLAHAPRAWLLSHDPAALARMAALVEPPPPAGAMRVAVVPAGVGRWRVETACRDQRGLLASIAWGLAATGLDVLDASAATWPDRTVIDAFTVSAVTPPDAEALRSDLMSALRVPADAAPVDGAVVLFDDVASPWYTLCTIEAPDHP